ncbi:hypothetical protein [Cohnella thermotolerans]|uniref:hypothetical protein n=1 Tax=Cohnella thermotolerans TaxID=329858 RepID=UPI0004052622|nr:hypothetical protein [Cohnella thermotolerans]
MFLYDNEQAEKIREHSQRMEQRGEIEPWLLELTYDAKLFKAFVPRELGGLALGLPEALRLFERASWIDGAFGWLVTIGSGGGFFCATLPEREAAALFSGREAVLAGSGLPTGTAKPVEGGYRVSGRWKFCSGSTYASFYTANCMIEGEGEPRMRSFAFLPEQVEVIRDWNSLGLRATSSHSIAVRDAFVPESMTFDIASEPRYDDPIYRVPFLPFAQTSFAAVSIGIARHFLEECRSFADLKAPEWSAAQPRRLEALLGAVEAQENRLNAACDRFYAAVESSWAAFVREGALPDVRWDEVGRVSQEAAGEARSGAQAVFPLLGMTALLNDHPLNRTWRDLHTVTQHSVLLSL